MAARLNLGRGRFVALSVLLHLGAAVMLLRLGSSKRAAPAGVTEVTVPLPAPPATPPPVQAPHAPPSGARAALRRGAPTSSLELPAERRRRLSEEQHDAPALAPPRAAPEPSPRTPPTIDLFSRDAIDRAIAASSPPGAPARDSTARARDGVPGGQAPARDWAGEREEVGARVQQFVDDASNRVRTRSGLVASRWRDAERRLLERFQPPMAVVQQEPTAGTFLKQYLAATPQGGPVPRGVDSSVQSPLGVPEGANLRSTPLEQTGAAIAATGQPASWLRTEVEVVLDASGAVVSAHPALRSGVRRFDQLAVAAVVQAVEHGGPLDESRGMITRWSVEASVAAAPLPTLGLSVDPTGKQKAGSSGIGRYVDIGYPLKKTVVTKVALLSAVRR